LTLMVVCPESPYVGVNRKRADRLLLLDGG